MLFKILIEKTMLFILFSLLFPSFFFFFFFLKKKKRILPFGIFLTEGEENKQTNKTIFWFFLLYC